MKITNTPPENWKDLEYKVCKFLNEAGYLAETGKKIITVRGEVQVDVYAESNTDLVKSFICECKYWNSPIPQEKIHAFRSVVADSGAMLGIIISKNGFQSGAYKAAHSTNLLLKDWDGFIDLIENQWIKKQMIRIKKLSLPLSVYTDHLDVNANDLPAHKKQEYIDTTISCVEAYLACTQMNKAILSQDKISIHNKTFAALDELFCYLETLFTKTIQRYEEIFKDSPIEDWKFECNDYLFISNIQDFIE